MVKHGKIIGEVAGGGLLLKRMLELCRKVIDGGDGEARLVRQVLAGRSNVCGGPPAIRFEFSRCGTVTDHSDGQIR
eukprot:3791837-Pleurochrysis_carterae.AAC.1